MNVGKHSDLLGFMFYEIRIQIQLPHRRSYTETEIIMGISKTLLADTYKGGMRNVRHWQTTTLYLSCLHSSCEDPLGIDRVFLLCLSRLTWEVIHPD